MVAVSDGVKKQLKRFVKKAVKQCLRLLHKIQTHKRFRRLLIYLMSYAINFEHTLNQLHELCAHRLIF